jgi:hypothetical protein
MPVSEKQLNANRENAKKSSGPKTEEGKKRSALNGSRHNLTGAAYVMSDEDRQAFDKFSGPFIAAFKPADPAEHSFAHLVAVAHWRLNRVHAIEENTFSMGHFTRASDVSADHPELHHALTQARVFDLKGETFRNLSIYEQRIAREMNRHLRNLFLLQDRRKAEDLGKSREAEREAAKPRTMAAAAGSDKPAETAAETTSAPTEPIADAPLTPTQTTAKTASSISDASLIPTQASAKTASFIADTSLTPTETVAKAGFTGQNDFAFSNTHTAPTAPSQPTPTNPLQEDKRAA